MALAPSPGQHLNHGRRRGSAAPADSGGAYITWIDEQRVRLRRIGADGGSAAGWPAEGHPVTAPALDGVQHTPYVVEDGSGGALVAWIENELGSWGELRVQRIRADAATVEGWPARGVSVCALTGTARNPMLTAGNQGASMAVWRQQEDDGTQSIRLQRVLLTGSVAPGWPANGQVLDREHELMDYPEIVADGAGGAVVGWCRSSDIPYTLEFRLTRVTPSGAPAVGWPAGGLSVTALRRDGLAGEDEDRPHLAEDGTGGAFVVWTSVSDAGPLGPTSDVAIQHVTGRCRIPHGWPTGGRALAPGRAPRERPDIVADGSGGAFVAWTKFQGARQTRVAHLDASGGVDPADGRTVAADHGYDPVLAADGAGGVFVAWGELGPSRMRPRMQHLARTGKPSTFGDTTSFVLGSGDADIVHLRLVADGVGGAFAFWQEAADSSRWRIVVKNPRPGRALSAPGAEAQAIPPPPFALLPPHPNPVRDRTTISFQIPRALLVVGPQGNVTLDLRLSPNPSTGSLSIAFWMPERATARLDVMDLTGRVVATLADRELEGGGHRFVWDGKSKTGRRSPAGVYVCLLKMSGRQEVRKFTFIGSPAR